MVVAFTNSFICETGDNIFGFDATDAAKLLNGSHQNHNFTHDSFLSFFTHINFFLTALSIFNFYNQTSGFCSQMFSNHNDKHYLSSLESKPNSNTGRAAAIGDGDHHYRG